MTPNSPIITSLESLRRLKQMRYNPMRSLKPAMLANALESFDIGYLREGAILFEAIADKDDTIKSVKPKREKEVSQLDKQVVALPRTGDAGEAQRQVLDDFWSNVRAVNAYDRNEKGGFRRLVKQMMASVSYRYAVHHIVWRPTRDGLRATFEFVPLWLFENRTGTLRYLRDPFAQDGELLNPDEWMVTQGDGLMISCSIGYLAKRSAFNDWLIFSEKFSVPGVLGRTSAKKDSPEGLAMRQAVKSFGHDWVGVIYGDDGTHEKPIDIIQASGNPSGMPMPAVVERVDRKFAALYRGADLSTMSAGSGEGSGASLQGKETRILLADDAETINETLAEVSRMVIEWHFGRGVEPLAAVQLMVPTDEDEKFYLESVTALKGMGVRISKDAVLDRLGIQEADEGEAALGDAVPPATNGTDEINAYNPLQARNPAGAHGGGRWTRDPSTAVERKARRGKMRPATADDRKRFGIPPAYTDAMVTDDPAAELLATARTANKKKVSYYSKEYKDSQVAAKFSRVAALHENMPQLQARIDRDIMSGGPDSDQALKLRMVSITGMRNGGDDGGGKVEAFGVSNLLTSHAKVTGSHIALDFIGKKGVRQIHSLDDSQIARHILKRQAEGGGRIFAGNSDKTFGYLTKISGGKFKVHDFRTWNATMLGAATAEKIAKRGELPTNDKEFAAFQKRVSKVVARQLGNTPAMALRAYIHPLVFEDYRPEPASTALTA